MHLRVGDERLRFLLLATAATVVLAGLDLAGADFAKLSAVTFGWFVFLTVGILLLERLRYGVELSVGKWVAICVVVVAQAYLVLGGPSKS